MSKISRIKVTDRYVSILLYEAKMPGNQEMTKWFDEAEIKTQKLKYGVSAIHVTPK